MRSKQTRLAEAYHSARIVDAERIDTPSRSPDCQEVVISANDVATLGLGRHGSRSRTSWATARCDFRFYTKALKINPHLKCPGEASKIYANN